MPDEPEKERKPIESPDFLAEKNSLLCDKIILQ
jgi:hypothetical protein